MSDNFEDRVEAEPLRTGEPRANAAPTPVSSSGGMSEATVRRVLDLLEVYAPGEFTLEMAATVTSAALEGGANG